MSYRININVLIRYPINIKPFVSYLLIIIYYFFISNRINIIISFCMMEFIRVKLFYFLFFFKHIK